MTKWKHRASAGGRRRPWIAGSLGMLAGVLVATGMTPDAHSTHSAGATVMRETKDHRVDPKIRALAVWAWTLADHGRSFRFLRHPQSGIYLPDAAGAWFPRGSASAASVLTAALGGDNWRTYMGGPPEWVQIKVTHRGVSAPSAKATFRVKGGTYTQTFSLGRKLRDEAYRIFGVDPSDSAPAADERPVAPFWRRLLSDGPAVANTGPAS